MQLFSVRLKANVCGAAPVSQRLKLCSHFEGPDASPALSIFNEWFGVPPSGGQRRF
jgi:hypothetical protein